MAVITCQFCLIAVRGRWQQCLSSSHPHVLSSLFRHVCECPNNYNIPLNGFVNGFQITPGVYFLFFSMGWQLALQIRGQVLFDFVLLFFVWPHMNSTADLYAMSKQIKVSTVVSALSHNIIVTSDWAWRNNGEHIYKGPISDMSPWSVLLQHHETIDRDIMKEQSVKSNTTIMWPNF